MLNFQTAIQKTSKAKESCYNLASSAFMAGDAETQTRLYEIIDGIQVQLDNLITLEIEKNYRVPARGISTGEGD